MKTSAHARLWLAAALILVVGFVATGHLSQWHALFMRDRLADPMMRGVAEFRAANFKAAAETFGGIDTAAAAYNQGNALVMLGKYDDAMARYDRALQMQPGWPEAEANRALARLRAERVKRKGGDAGDQREGADKIVYDKDKKNDGGQKTDVDGAMDDQSVRALWLKRIEPRPAEFLRQRFLWQLENVR